MAYNVIGDLKNRDKHTFEILTGKFQYYADHCCGKRYYGAIKTSTIARGSVTMKPGDTRLGSITISGNGEGYTTAPKVVFTGGGGTGAVATASIYNGRVVLVNIIQRGNGYSTAPTVTFEGGGYTTRATATATLAPQEPAIDFTKALAVPGVRAVLNHLDARGNTTQTLVLNTTINYWGTPVAAVVADDHETAVYACGLIDVEYTPLPWVTSPYEAMKPGATVINGTGNLSNITASTGPRPENLTDAGVTSALARCQYQAEHEQGFSTVYAHNMLEPHGNTAWWVGDHVYCWTGSQNLHSCHNTLVSNLGRGSITHTVHSFTQGTGGGHGDKNNAPNMGLTARMSLMMGGAPVTLVETRAVNITAHARQSGAYHKIVLGGETKGKIDVFDAAGRSCGTTTGGGQIASIGMHQSYTIPTYRYTLQHVYTNTPTRGSYRCVGDPPACIAYDAAIDKLAHAMDMSPYELRRDNLRDSTSPPQEGYSVFQGLQLKQMLEILRTESNYTSKWTKAGTSNPRDKGSKKYGIGIACHVDSHGNVNGNARRMSMTMNCISNIPVAYINAGFCRGPSGAPSAMASIVAETVGLGYDNVYVTDFGRTDRSLDSSMQAGSRFTAGAGGAAYNMAMKARNEILTLALANNTFAGRAVPSDRTLATATASVVDGRIGSITVTEPGDGYTGAPRVVISGGGGSGATAVAHVVDGKVVSIGVVSPGAGYTTTPSVEIGWLSVEDFDPKNNVVYLKESLAPSTVFVNIGNLISNTSATPGVDGFAGAGWNGVGWDPPSGINTHGSCGTVVELFVDTDTGEVDVEAMYNVIETGRTIFRRGAIKEMLSGCELIIGQTLFFADIYDHWHTGALIGTQYSQSQVPTSMDIPKDLYVYDMESDCGGPYGAHGIGEPCCSNVGALNCAIYNAIGLFPDPELGAMNPDKILKVLGKA